MVGSHIKSVIGTPGPIALLVVSPTADPGVWSSIPAWSRTVDTFVEIDHEIISTVILLRKIQERLVTSLGLCMKYWLTT